MSWAPAVLCEGPDSPVLIGSPINVADFLIGPPSSWQSTARQTRRGARQVKNAAGEWIMAPPVPGTLVCNIGDCLKFFSNGRYQSTPHRVINGDPSRSRVSCPFFYEPAFEAVVEPIAELCLEG